jgi:hypothetical protein
MNRLQLEHIIRATGSIADDHEIIVLGSASVLSQFPDLDERFVVSVEADVFPRNKPELSDIIDGSIGELSPFHTTFGYYAHGVSQETANNLPAGWDARLIPIKSSNTGGVTGWCVEIHDLVTGKYVSAREKDIDFIRLAIDARMVKQDILVERVQALRVDASEKERIHLRAIEDFRRSSLKVA